MKRIHHIEVSQESFNALMRGEKMFITTEKPDVKMYDLVIVKKENTDSAEIYNVGLLS